ncbi:MAG TPA: CrcB family protein [Candidatus Microbacterium pullistercoris]|nr:CrcB family protein [Candidatus Microbacterium pullistercoris]
MAGGAIGVLARYVLTLAWPDERLLTVSVINVVGSLLLGIVAASFATSPLKRALLGTGLLGGFTSYSALVPLLSRSAVDALAAGILVGQVVLGAVAAFAGLALGGSFARRRAA